jgi:shikimate dehydrogenase
VLHRTAYALLGLDWQYGRHEVQEAGLAAFLAGLDPSWRGLSLTMPLKEAALGCVDEVSDLARLVRAVNTVLLEPDGRRVGDNTDVPGMVAALRERGVDRAPTATLLGGGATARSALASLAQVADRVRAYVRTSARAGELREVASALGLACEVLPWEDRHAGLGARLVVVTTPAAGSADLAGVEAPADGVLLDVAYDPWPTPAATAWGRAGATVVSGLDLLAHQAVLQVTLMTGRQVPVGPLRDAGRAALDAR